MTFVSADNNTKNELIEKVDKSLIVGAIIRMGDTQLDSSVSSKLKVLRQKFSENLYIENY
jgi:F-type H+-transporting ATPase subunit delta